MDETLAAVLGAIVGLLIGAVALVAFRHSERAGGPGGRAGGSLGGSTGTLPPDVGRVLSVLRSSTVVVGQRDEVLHASVPARVLGLVRGDRLVPGELADLVRQVRRDGEIRESDLELVPDHGRHQHAQEHYLSARVAPLSSRLVLVLVEDRTKEHRLDAIRRDFVANVSHELKTPIGALGLLAEAVQEAADDPAAVQRFSTRMQVENERLTRLVHQIIELSRVQGDDPVAEAVPVPVDRVVDAALDRCRIAAQRKNIGLVRTGLRGAVVHGSEQQLVIALGNLVENAVRYSVDRARVVVDVRRASRDAGSPGGPLGGPLGGPDLVELAVTDRGVGISERELTRVFERFYRVDRARSRETGGTGLGLSIVKHVAAAHGGTVDASSVPGQGSTFLLRIPVRPEATPGPAKPPTRTRARAGADRPEVVS